MGSNDIKMWESSQTAAWARRKVGLPTDDDRQGVHRADGVSCRTQADAFEGVEGLRLAQVLAARLER